MKIFNKLILTTAIIIYTTVVSMAAEQPVFAVQATDNVTIAIDLKNVAQPKIQVTLKDLKGVIMHDETLSRNNINFRKYNLKNLPVGNYVLMVSYDDVIKVQKIKKLLENIIIEEDKMQTIFHPTFVENSDYVDIKMLAFSKQKILLEIIDEEGHTIHSEYNHVKGMFKKRYKLSELEKGYYTFSVGLVGSVDTFIDKEFKQSVNWSPAIASL